MGTEGLPAGLAEGSRYWCPTCQQEISPQKVHHGTQAIVHVARVPREDGCNGCPPKAVPHRVVKQIIQGTIVREET